MCKSTSTSSKDRGGGGGKVKENKKKVDNVTKDIGITNLVGKVISLIQSPRDEDSNIQYQLISLNTGIYKSGDDSSTARRQKNSSHCNKLCPCSVGESKFCEFTKWLGDEKRKVILQRI